MSNIRTPTSKGAALNVTEAVNTWRRTTQTKAGNYTLAYMDNRDSIDFTAAATITIPVISTLIALCETGDFEITLNNLSGVQCTITCASVTDTIAGSVSDYILNSSQSITLKVNYTANGMIITSGANSGTITYTPIALTDGATISTNAALGNIFTVTLAGNRTLANPTGLISNQPVVYHITQDGSGSRLLSFGSNFKFPGGVAVILSTAPGAKDTITCLWDGTILRCSIVKAYG